MPQMRQQVDVVTILRRPMVVREARTAEMVEPPLPLLWGHHSSG